jgi:DNA (cytosine-5)-methyltransferase 1
MNANKKKPSNSALTQLTSIDLFSGCGGFTVGLRRAGFKCLAAVDYDEAAISTLRDNLPDVKVALREDLTEFGPEDLDEYLQGETVDVIVGGPPCQGFSKARQVDGSNHGERLVSDPRRDLYKEFLRYVAYYQPKVFVMENVLGIRSAASGEFFTRVQTEARALGYRVHPEEVRAWRYGAPQKRVRQLIIGTRRELPLFVASKYLRETHRTPDEPKADHLEEAVTLWEAIGDLPPLRVDSGRHREHYDFSRRATHVTRYGTRFLRDVIEFHVSTELTSHVARPHSERDLRDFDRLAEGETSRQALARKVEMEFPYDRGTFKDRYTKQHRNRLCSTIVAHLSKDGLMFIHPTQRRSLTPREAARVQTFPDWYEFPEARTFTYRMIGNAVPPVVATAIGEAITTYLQDVDANAGVVGGPAVPVSVADACEWLETLQPALGDGVSGLRKAGDTELLRAWRAVAFLLPELHPDGAVDSGRETRAADASQPVGQSLSTPVANLLAKVYRRSGWPVALLPLAEEVRRRFELGLVSVEDYYCSEAHVAGAANAGVCE